MSTEAFPEIDFASLDYTKLAADVAAIERINPHRAAMRLIDGVLRMHADTHVIVGFKDVRAEEFWASGHFPGWSVFPGVLMCEAAAQLANYYTVERSIIARDRLVGLGGIDETRFRETVRPGDRLVLVGKGLRVSTRMTRFQVKGFVKRDADHVLAFETIVIGIPLGSFEELKRA